MGSCHNKLMATTPAYQPFDHTCDTVLSLPSAATRNAHVLFPDSYAECHPSIKLYLTMAAKVSARTSSSSRHAAAGSSSTGALTRFQASSTVSQPPQRMIQEWQPQLSPEPVNCRCHWQSKTSWWASVALQGSPALDNPWL